MKQLIAAMLLLALLAGCASATTEPPAISQAEAQQLALDHAGLTAEQVLGLRTQPDRDDGIYHYDVEFYCDGFEYEYEIHGQSGQILKAEKDRD